MSESTPESPAQPPPEVQRRAPLRRRIVTTVGLIGVLVGAKFGYEIGVTITAPWLGVVMGLNTALFTGLVASMVCDRVLRALWRNG